MENLIGYILKLCNCLFVRVMVGTEEKNTAGRPAKLQPSNHQRLKKQRPTTI